MITVKDIDDVRYWFNYFLNQLEKKIDFQNDRNALKTMQIVLKCKNLINYEGARGGDEREQEVSVLL